MLIAAGLAAAPASVVAGPDKADPKKNDSFERSERFEWSTGRSHLGVMVMGLTPELRNHFGVPNDRGLLVARVDPKSPAAKAGIIPGDILTDVGGQAIEDVGDVFSALAAAAPGKPVAVRLVRERIQMTIDVTPAKSTATRSPEWMREMMKRMFDFDLDSISPSRKPNSQST
jgi:predicted metalloprotease with PDZ domain